MSEALKKILKLNKRLPVREEAILNLRVAANFVNNSFENLVSKFGITATQYNVLRILKGIYPKGHPRCEIMIRMIEKAPDITRLIDRLEKQNFVERDRNIDDRRKSITKITEAGLEVVKKIQPYLENEIELITKNFSNRDCQLISELMEKMYDKAY
jgi:DNA-binding MarR family transcriptional regulator